LHVDHTALTAKLSEEFANKITPCVS
jgi:hypothetical protein